MITAKEAKVGARVKWSDTNQQSDFGTIISISSDGRCVIACDDGEEGDSYIDNAASLWSIAR